MLVTRAELPVRPTYNHGESVVGYLFRIYSCNGHSLPEGIFTLIEVLYRAHQNRFLVDALAEIQRIIGSEYELNPARWLNLEHGTRGNAIWEKWSRSLDVIFKYCPKCLRQYDYHLAIWERKFVTVCPAHNCRLVRHCPSCKRPLTWLTLQSGWRCPCGQQLIDIRPIEVSSQLARLSRYLCSTWDTDLPKDYPLEIPRNPQSLLLAYRTIYHLALLRGFVVAVYRDANSDLNMARQYAAECLRKSRLSVARLITQDGFSAPLCKLLRIRRQETDALLIRVPRESREMAILKFLASIDSDLSWHTPLGDRLRYFFIEHEAPLSFSDLVIFNPKISIPQRRALLVEFVKWCKRQFKPSNEQSIPFGEARPLGTHSIVSRESEAINVLSKLIQLSQSQTRCKKELRSLISIFLLPTGVPIHDAALLRNLAYGLVRLSESQFDLIRNLVDQHLRSKRVKASTADGTT